jgi:hypothetical protein
MPEIMANNTKKDPRASQGSSPTDSLQGFNPMNWQASHGQVQARVDLD